MPYTPRILRAFTRANVSSEVVNRETRWSKSWFSALHSYLSWVSKGMAYYYADMPENAIYRDPLPEFKDIRAEVPKGLLRYFANSITDPRISGWFHHER